MTITKQEMYITTNQGCTGWLSIFTETQTSYLPSSSSTASWMLWWLLRVVVVVVAFVEGRWCTAGLFSLTGITKSPPILDWAKRLLEFPYIDMGLVALSCTSGEELMVVRFPTDAEVLLAHSDKPRKLLLLLVMEVGEVRSPREEVDVNTGLVLMLFLFCCCIPVLEPMFLKSVLMFSTNNP